MPDHEVRFDTFSLLGALANPRGLKPRAVPCALIYAFAVVGSLKDALQKMDELSAAIAAGEIGRARAWGGAGVAITRQARPPRPDHFYPEPRWVVTPFVSELSWLFKELWVGFRPLMDHTTKFEFFGRLGNAASRYHETAGPDASARGLLNAVLTKAWSIAAEVASDTFMALPAAPGRAIAEDFIPPEDRP